MEAAYHDPLVRSSLGLRGTVMFDKHTNLGETEDPTRTYGAYVSRRTRWLRLSVGLGLEATGPPGTPPQSEGKGQQGGSVLYIQDFGRRRTS